MENYAENVHQKLNNHKQSSHARNSFKIRYFQKGLSKCRHKK